MGSNPAGVRISCVTENYIDMLLPDGHNVTRAGLVHHFDPKRLTPVAENGIALHVEIEWGRYSYRALFDTGMTGAVLLHNARALDLNPDQLDHLVLSHGHPDHYGGLMDLLAAREHPLPVSVHPEAFLARYLRLASGEVAPFYNADLTLAGIQDAGGRPVLHSSPLEIGPGMIATGEVPRKFDFEQPNEDTEAPNALLQVSEGNSRIDSVGDDQALVIRVGDGIVVLVGCSHAGIINTITHAMALTGVERVLGVFGGFHLGFPGTPEAKLKRTIEELRNIGVEMLCPMHCTGMRAMMELEAAFPEQFVLCCTGSCVEISG